jgi:hypothetical protein
MFYDAGCYGQVPLGDLPESTQRRLAALPGEWLEFDMPAGRIVVRHVQPTSGPCLPTITGELVRMLAEIPVEQRGAIPGGDLVVHTEESAQLVRLRVEPGGALRIEWARPDYTRARRRRYEGGRLEMVEPRVQRLNGRVTFATPDPARAATELQQLADGYEGLYPEGDLIVRPDAGGRAVTVDVRDLNVDAVLLVERLARMAVAGSLAGQIEVGSFGAVVPEQHLRFVFADGDTWVQRPVLWPDAEDAEPATAGTA